MLAGLDWLDSLSLTGLDGQNLNEIGLKNGNLIVDDQQRGNKWNFENITLSLRRPSGGGVALSVGEEGSHAWSLRVVVGPPANGVRSVDIRADKVSTTNILLALRMKDLTYSADLPLTGELKGELGRDGLPTYFRGKITAGAGNIIDSDTPDYPMAIDSAEMNVEWDSGRRVLVAPFKIISGANRITLLAHLEPPNDSVTDWQLGFSGGTIVLAGIDGEPPLIFNRIAIGLRFDTDKRRVLLTQADISNGEIGIAGTGSVDYSAEPRLTLGFAGTPMSASALKRMWPILIVPEVREWVIERIERGSLQRIEVGVNSPVRNLSRRGPPIPDDGLAINIVASGVTLHPVDELPSVRDADLKARVTGRTATVTIAQAASDTPTGRKLNISDFVFEVPDMAPKPAPARVKFRIDGPVPAAAEILASDRLSEFSGTLIDPNSSKGTVSAVVTLGLPIKRELTKADTTYAITGRPRRICRRQTGDEPEARSQRAEGHRQQRRLSGQGRRQDQRAGGHAGLSQAERGRCRYQIAGDARRRQPRAPRIRSRPRGQRRHSDQADRQDRRPRSRQPHGHRRRSDRVEARQYPAGLGQVAGQVEPRGFQRGAEAAIDPARRHRHRWRRRVDQGIARGRSERRPDQRELPDLFAVRRRQDLAEGRTRLRWRRER